MSNKGSKLTPEQEQQIIELYLCHFTANETSKILGISYQSIMLRYRALKYWRNKHWFKKYSRYALIDKSILHLFPPSVIDNAETHSSEGNLEGHTIEKPNYFYNGAYHVYNF